LTTRNFVLLYCRSNNHNFPFNNLLRLFAGNSVSRKINTHSIASEAFTFTKEKISAIKYVFTLAYEKLSIACEKLSIACEKASIVCEKLS